MVDDSGVAVETNSDSAGGRQLCLRQIEVNTIASSFAGLTSTVVRDFQE